MKFYIRNVDWGLGHEGRFEELYGEDLEKLKLRKLVPQEENLNPINYVPYGDHIIEVNTLEELMEMAEKVGPIIIDSPQKDLQGNYVLNEFGEQVWEIQIYDDYIE